MPAFVDPTEPVADPGEAVRLEPLNEVREILATEQMARIGPTDYGGQNSGTSSSVTGLEDELDFTENNLGQIFVNPLSQVEVEIRQTGDQDQRFVNKNQVGVITPESPPEQRLIWVFEDEGINAIFTNPKTYDLDRTLVYYTGYKFRVSEPLSEDQINRLPGHPSSVPVDTLKQPGVR